MKQSASQQSAGKLALWCIYFLSGAAALGFQVVWSKMLALSLGHEFRAVVAVVAAFFGGMALGGALSAKFRFTVPRVELVIGAWGAGSALLLPWANEKILFALGPIGSAVCSFLLLLPATIAMGATLPAMVALSGDTRSAYAGNTFGGVLGCIGAAFVLMPKFSFTTCLCIFAVCNLSAAFLAYCCRNRRQEILTESAKRIQNLLPSIPTNLVFFLTGFIALGFETVGVRLLTQSLENTVYTFALTLAIYLCGNALGAAVSRRFRLSAGFSFGGVVIAILISIPIFSHTPEVYESLRKSFGDSAGAVSLSEFIVTLSVFGLPALFMGALFAGLAEKIGPAKLGFALFSNSLGCALGAALVPLLIVPHLSQSLARAPESQTIVAHRNGVMASVMVTESPDRNHTLFVNNRFQMGGTAAAIPELRQAHIPFLLATRRERALFLGVGTGISLSAAAAYEGLQADAVELLPEVVDVIPQFTQLNSTNIHLHVADARRFIRQTTNTYDIIVGELFHPAQDGAGFLYTAEHFRRIKSRLTDYGVFCQWLPLHQLDLENFRVIAATFLSVYPEAEVYLLRFNIDAPVIGLVGWNRKENPKLDVIETLPDEPKLGPELKRIALADSIRLLGCQLADNTQLRRFASGAPLNIDNHPIVIFEAPRFSYLRNTPTYERLIAFMDSIGDRPSEEFATPRHLQFARARDTYLRALVLESKGDSRRALDGYVESARLSADFTSGYAQCLAIAAAKSKTDPEAAKQILRRLLDAQPTRPVAKEMLERLGP